jgi:hypothetical protein
MGRPVGRPYSRFCLRGHDKERVGVIGKSYCRACANERGRRLYWEDPSKSNTNRKKNYWKDPQSHRDKTRQWAKENPEKRREQNHRRRERHAGIRLVFPLTGSNCYVCHQPLHPELSYPHPMSTSIGHEPPLAKLKKLGQDWCYVRPEHLTCNVQKQARTDSEFGLRRVHATRNVHLD